MSQPIITPASPPSQSATIHLLPPPFTNTSPPPKLITQGAESLLYCTHYLTPSTPAALKIRPAKPWRHPVLDARLTKQRVLAEARVLVKLTVLGEKDVQVPAVYSVEWDMARRVKTLDSSQREVRPEGAVPTGGKGTWILMEWIEGFGVKDVLRDCDRRVKSGEVSGEEVEESVRKLLRRIGRAVGVLHARGGVVHGDLTTSNIMVRPTKERVTNGEVVTPAVDGDADEENPEASKILLKSYEIVLIDFGLATQSIQDEDRAVDLYVLERAFGSTHPRQEGWFDKEVLQSQEGYRGAFPGSKVVLKRLQDVRMRGRKRSMVG
jgi:TP53 regulating kinase and related kinases